MRTTHCDSERNEESAGSRKFSYFATASTRASRGFPASVAYCHSVPLPYQLRKLPEFLIGSIVPQECRRALQLRRVRTRSISYQRRDNLTMAIHMAVQAIFWFHPSDMVDRSPFACRAGASMR